MAWGLGGNPEVYRQKCRRLNRAINALKKVAEDVIGETMYHTDDAERLRQLMLKVLQHYTSPGKIEYDSFERKTPEAIELKRLLRSRKCQSIKDNH